jgi:hypothetical protein
MLQLRHHAQKASVSYPRADGSTAGVSSFGIIPARGLSYMQADRLERVLDRTIGDALRAAADAWGERAALGWNEQISEAESMRHF